MSLRAFHLLFIALSVVMAAYFGTWLVGEYRAVHQLGYALGGVLSLLSAVGLALYGAAFQRKTRWM